MKPLERIPLHDHTDNNAGGHLDSASLEGLIDLGGAAGAAEAVCGPTDTFTRVVSGSWGTSDAGIAWAADTSGAQTYAVTGSVGAMTGSHADNAIQRLPLTDEAAPDKEITFDLRLDSTTGLANGQFAFDTWYGGGYSSRGEVAFDWYPAGDTTPPFGILASIPVNGLWLGYMNDTDSFEATVAKALTVGTWYTIRLVVNHTGKFAGAKIWPRGTAEPAVWDLYLDFSSTAGTWDPTFGPIPGTVFGISSEKSASIDNLAVEAVCGTAPAAAPSDTPAVLSGDTVTSATLAADANDWAP